jgi:hypothetical protein
MYALLNLIFFLLFIHTELCMDILTYLYFLALQLKLAANNMNRLSILASIFSDVDSDFAMHTCRSRCLPFQVKNVYHIFS